MASAAARCYRGAGFGGAQLRGWGTLRRVWRVGWAVALGLSVLGACGRPAAKAPGTAPLSSLGADSAAASGSAAGVTGASAPPGPLPAGPVRALALDPAEQTVALACTDAGLWRTSDGGATWRAVLQPAPDPQAPDAGCRAVAFDPWTSGVAVTLCEHHAYRSTDGGTTWRAWPAYSSALQRVAFDPADAGRVVASWWASAPGGDVEWTEGTSAWWQDSAGLPAAPSRYVLGMAAGVPGTVWALDALHGVLYVSRDAGRSFEVVGGQAGVPKWAPEYGEPLLVSPDGRTLVYASSRSDDGGRTWRALPSPPVDYVLAARFGQALQLVGTVANMSNRIELSSDGGASWRPIQLGGQPRALAAVFDGSGRLWLGTDRGLYRIPAA